MTEAERTITTPGQTPEELPEGPSAETSGQGPAPTDGADGASDVAGAAEGASGAAEAADGTAGATPADSTADGAAGSAPDPAADPAADGAAEGASEGATADGTPRRRVAVLIGVAVLAYLLDLLSKMWVVHSLEHRDAVHVIGHYVQLDVIRNSGAAFSLGEGMTIVFTVIAAGVIVVIARLARRLHSVPWAIALGLLLGGAFGNLTDRIFRTPGDLQGRVVDFIDTAHFAVFNLADSAITCGGVLIVLLSFSGVDPDGKRHRD